MLYSFCLRFFIRFEVNRDDTTKKVEDETFRMTHGDDKRTNHFLQERDLAIKQDVLVVFCAFSLNDKNTLYISVTDIVLFDPESNNNKPFCSESHHTSKIVIEIQKQALRKIN